MERYGPETYGEGIADVYDTWFASMDPTPAVELLASLAGEGPILELAVGTGRVAVPLAERGFDVHGIDASDAMVEQLRAKPGGAKVNVTMGDMADVAAATEESFSLVFVAFNSLFALLTQDDQVRCFANVANRLAPGGRFVLECFVPDPARFDRGQRVEAGNVGLDWVKVDFSRHSPATQQVDGQHLLITGNGIRLMPVSLRYAWPSELDLMARLAGLTLCHRWSGWQREPFDDTSGSHVSVYERPHEG